MNEPLGDSPRAPELPSASRPLRIRRLREIVAAPELERYLGLRGVDLQVLDQVEALRVRVGQGLAVAARRAKAARGHARRVIFASVAGAGIGIAVGAVAIAGGQREHIDAAGSFAIALAALVLFIASAVIAVIAISDLRRIRELERNCLRALPNDADLHALASFARQIWEEILALSTTKGGDTATPVDTVEKRR
jgi:hypothetical protein